MINTRTLPNGNLLLTADNETRSDLAHAYRSGGYPRAESDVQDGLHEVFAFIAPEDIGALTEAPILTPYDECEFPDDGHGFTPLPGAPVYWFPDHAVRDPWQELARKGRVEFQCASED